MKLQQLGNRMRRFESANNATVLPGIYIVARVDGRCFTRLTKEEHNFEAPYDARFRDIMVETAKALMRSGPAITYAYTQSDEISLLLRRDDGAFGRRLDKLNSIFAGVASASFSLSLKSVAIFDCRISQLPNHQQVRDYFRWRQADARRNAISGHCYWLLRGEGLSEQGATEALMGMNENARQDLMMGRGRNFNNLPAWQKRGIGLSWQDVERSATNPKTGASVIATRRQLTVDMDLPFRDAYNTYLDERLVA